MISRRLSFCCYTLQVITDPVSGRSKGYGFVRFANEQERDRALGDMQGHYISSRPIRVSLATARRNPGPGGVTHPSELDPTNTTLFIGGLSAGVSEEQLRSIFGRFGDIVYTKIPQGKGCGFVQFVDRRAAEIAMAEMNGQVIGSSAIRISWGRSTSRAAAVREREGGVSFGAGLPMAYGYDAAAAPAGFAGYPAASAAYGGADLYNYQGEGAPTSYGMDAAFAVSRVCTQQSPLSATGVSASSA